jgi:hypothetical protein
MILLFVLPCTLFVALASSTSGDQHFCVFVTSIRQQYHRDWGRAGTAGNRFARDDKELELQQGGDYPEIGLVKPPRRNTRALSPDGMFGGARYTSARSTGFCAIYVCISSSSRKGAPPLSGTEEQAACAISAYAPLAPMRSTPAYFLCKCGL